jgi:hypothetical protein
MTAETLESLRASFNRRLRAEGKADRTLVLYGQLHARREPELLPESQ